VLGLVYSGQTAGLLNCWSLSAVSAVVVLVWWVGDKLYYAGLIGSSEVASKRKALTESAFQRLVKPSPPLIAYLMKEIRLVLRTPAYFMNSHPD
jgi:ABC-2 type transport system permease protein